MVRQTPQGFKDIATPHLKCRAFRHPWDPIALILVTYDRKNARELTLRCLRKGCEAERVDTRLDSNGELVARRYYLPENYLIKGRAKWGDARTFNRNVQIEVFNRLSVNGNLKRKGS